MLPEIESLTEKLYADAKRNREANLAGRIGDLTSDATLNGQLGAGRFHAMIVAEYAQEFRARADLLWDTLQRVLSAHGVLPSGELAATIKAFLTPRLARECDELTGLAGRDL